MLSGISRDLRPAHLEIARYLVELGIDSMNLTPDSLLKTMRGVFDLEKQLGREVRTPEAEAAPLRPVRAGNLDAHVYFKYDGPSLSR
jgi:hypothetical protein